VRAACVLVLALVVPACDPAVPPPVAQRQPSLDAEDVAVMNGVLDRLRARAARALIESRFLVVDTTLAVCDRDVMAFGPPPGGCLAPRWLEFVSRVLPPTNAREAMLDFQARNVKRLPIGGPLGADVTYIPATVTDFVSERDLLRQRPGAVVTFSAPAYPASRVAVIAYAVRHGELGAARLQQRAGGGWSVAEGGWYGAIE